MHSSYGLRLLGKGLLKLSIVLLVLYLGNGVKETMAGLQVDILVSQILKQARTSFLLFIFFFLLFAGEGVTLLLRRCVAQWCEETTMIS
jgi:hypothetical protein